MRVMIKSKIHRARVTDTDIDYEGSITIDRSLMQAADIAAYEQVHVLNINNGARFITYALEGEKGEICLNGAAARLVVKGDIVLVFAYCHIEDEQLGSFTPKLVYVDDKNNIIKTI